jgi:hypothetical protein
MLLSPSIDSIIKDMLNMYKKLAKTILDAKKISMKVKSLSNNVLLFIDIIK